jgi:hypothetical protein
MGSRGAHIPFSIPISLPHSRHTNSAVFIFRAINYNKNTLAIAPESRRFPFNEFCILNSAGG